MDTAWAQDARGVAVGRVGLARPLADEVARPRLVDALAERWNVPVVLVVAPGGYGKSVALAQAIRDNDSDPTGIDAYVRCRAGHHDARTLTRAIVEALAQVVGTRDGTHLEGAAESVPGAVAESDAPSDTVTLADEIVRAMAEASPNDVCLHLDDVHLTGRIDGADDLLDLLVREMPHHGHLVLAGRSEPRVRLARLRAADAVLEVGPDQLGFDERETAELAANHGVEADRAADAAGWPALTRMAFAVGVAASRDFIVEEVVHAMSADQRLAVATTVLCGWADDDLLAAAGAGVRARELIADVPLLVEFDDGRIAAHDLWADVLDQLLPPGERDRAVEAVTDRLITTRDAHAAVDVALSAGRVDLARGAMRREFSHGDARLTRADISRWADGLAATDPAAPEVHVLESFRRRFDGDFEGALALLHELADDVRASGDLELETTVCFELTTLAWMRNDRTLLRELTAWSDDLIARGSRRMQVSRASGDALAADMRGDFAAALRKYERAGVDGELALRHRSTLAMLTGDADTARALLDRLLVEHPKPIVHGQAATVAWQCGDPGPWLSRRERIPLDNRRNEFLSLVFDGMVRASVGEVPELERIETLAWDRSREQMFVACCRAAHDLLVAGEEVARDGFARRVREIGVDDPLLQGEAKRFMAYSWVLSDDLRAWLDGLDDLGPLHVRTRELASAFLDVRQDRSAGVPDTITDAEVMTWLPLPWSVELAARLVERGDPRGMGLAEYLSDVVGTAAHRALRALAEADDPSLRSGAEEVLAAIPATPAAALRFTCRASTVVEEGDRRTEVQRQRPREVLQVLAVRGEVDRDALAAMLWPEAETSKAFASLRTALRHLRVDLEPDRKTNEAPFHLRQRGDAVALHRSEFLGCALWDARDALDRASTAMRSGDEPGAVTAFREAVEVWDPEAFPEARGLPDLVAELVALDAEVQRGGAWAGERLLARGDADEALAVGGRLLECDPFDERAHGVCIGALLALDDLAAARRAIVRCLEAVAELGVEPTPGLMMLVRRYERRSGDTIDPTTAARAG